MRDYKFKKVDSLLISVAFENEESTEPKILIVGRANPRGGDVPQIINAFDGGDAIRVYDLLTRKGVSIDDISKKVEEVSKEKA